MFQCRQLIPLLSLVLSVRGQLNLFGESCEEDDFVDVNFNGCESCEHNYRNMSNTLAVKLPSLLEYCSDCN
ncbi:hypothetical protein ACLKA6_003400 [Drosophila palustris]